MGCRFVTGRLDDGATTRRYERWIKGGTAKTAAPGRWMLSDEGWELEHNSKTDGNMNDCQGNSNCNCAGNKVWAKIFEEMIPRHLSDRL